MSVTDPSFLSDESLYSLCAYDSSSKLTVAGFNIIRSNISYHLVGFQISREQ